MCCDSNLHGIVDAKEAAELKAKQKKEEEERQKEIAAKKKDRDKNNNSGSSGGGSSSSVSVGWMVVPRFQRYSVSCAFSMLPVFHAGCDHF